MAAAARRRKEEEVPEVQEKEVPKPPKSLETQILSKLGTPPNFYKLQLVTVGDGRVRANVRCFVPSNNTVTVSTIKHSYYLKVDDAGNIVGGDEIVPTYKA